MTPSSIEFIKTVLISLVASGTVGTLITRWFDRHSKVAELQSIMDKMAEGMEVLLRNQNELLKILHAKGIINGESEELRKTLADYIYSSQAQTFQQKKKA